MTHLEFKQWRSTLKLSQQGAADALGCAKSTVIAYEKGGHVPRYIALACGALAYGLPPWRSSGLAAGQKQAP